MSHGVSRLAAHATAGRPLVWCLIGLLALAWAPARAAAQDRLPELPPLTLETFARDVREEIREAYERAAGRADEARVVGELGMLLHAHEHPEAAAACYRRARALDPTAFQWAYYAGLVLADLGRHDEAIQALREAVRLEPDYAPARLRLADALFDAGDLEAAAAAYDRVLESAPGTAAAHYGLGRVRAAMGRPEMAAEHHRRAVALFSAFGAAHYALAMVLRDLGDTAGAMEHLEQYRAHQLRAPPAGDAALEQVHALRGGARHHLRRGADLGNRDRIDESIREHLRALELEPALEQAHVNLISLYGRSGRYADAEAQYRALMAINPDVVDAHYNYGVLLVAAGRPEEAAGAFRRALALDPRHPTAHNNLAQVLERQGRLDEALDHYRVASEADPTLRVARFNMGRMLIALGRPREAADQFRQILSPEDEETPRYLFALSTAYVRAGDVERGLELGRQAKQRAEALGQHDLAAGIDRDLRQLEGRRPQ